MIDSFLTLFGDKINLYAWLFIFVVWFMMSRLEIDDSNIKIKVSIIYILMFFFAVTKIFEVFPLLVISTIIFFICFELIFIDNFTRKFIKKIRYIFLDFLYKLLFDYFYFYYLLSMLILKIDINFLTALISIIILLRGIIKCFNNEFEKSSNIEIFKKINDILSINQFQMTNQFIQFANLLTFKEDKSYFSREKSYNWISFDFIKYRLIRCNFKLFSIKEKIKFISKRFLLLIKKLFSFLKLLLLRRKNIKQYLRGYSTLEMQLIRTLSIKNGYSQHVYRRKIYEFVYSTIFFNSLKKYYEYFHYNNVEYFKYYLIYIYVNVAPVRINKKRFNTIFELYGKKDLSEITLEEFYIWVLGLSNHPINLNILSYPQPIILDRNSLKKLILKMSIYPLADEEEYNKIIKKFKKQKYYIEKNKADYLYYYFQNKDKLLKEIIGIVNTNSMTSENSVDLNEEVIIVNKYYYLNKNYIPRDLVKVETDYSEYDISLNEEAYIQFKLLYQAALKKGIKIMIISGYRDYCKQMKIWNQKSNCYSKEWIESYVAFPGHSEHQTGLAIDITIKKSLELNKCIEWLKLNSYKYGFILRYPKGKEEITGYNYEPFHYRYIGKKVAKIIFEEKITLDEYYEYYIRNK